MPELLDLLRAQAVGFLHVRRVLALPLGPGDLVARGVLLALQALELGDHPAPGGFERRDVLERLVGVEAAVAEAASGRPQHGRERRQDRASRPDSIVLQPIPAQAARSATMSNVTSIVRKAVFPAAGLGTRFLPATKAQPKEMLPLVDKPIIQYGVEEAVAVRRVEHHSGHRPRQERDRRSLRRVGGARDLSRSARQADTARRDPQDLEPDQLRVRPAGRAARARPRRARDARYRRRRAVRRDPRRRRDRRGPAGDQADDGRLRARRRAGARRRARAARGHLELRRHRTGHER